MFIYFIYNIKPNFATISKDYNDQKAQIISAINSMDSLHILKLLKDGNPIEINQDSLIQLNHQYFIIEEIPFEGYCLSSNKNLIASINTNLNESLVNEGMVRDLIRKIQNLRKDSDFKIDDRIDVYISTNEIINKAIEKNKNYLETEVLAVNLKLDSSLGNYKTEFFIKEIKVNLGISVNNK